MTIYDSDWYAEVVAPNSLLYDDGENRFRYEARGSEASGIYGYPGITGNKYAVRQLLGLSLFIRHRVDVRNCGRSWPTRVIPCDDPWPKGSPHLAESARAQRLGIYAEYHGSSRNALLAFLPPYLEAMASKGAPPKYSAIAERLELWAGNPHVHVVTAPEAGAIFFDDGEWGHYHLSYRTPKAHNTAMHAIFDRAVPVLTELGCKRIHLGGGTTSSPDDPLYKFKSRIGRVDWSINFEEVL